MKLWLAVLLIAASSGFASIASAQCERQKIEGAGLQDGDNFGSSVAVSGNWAVIGAPWVDDLGIYSNDGAVYVFERTPSGWQEGQRLKASDASPNAGFGQSVDIEGTTIAVGAAGASFQGMQYVGAIYIFEFSGGAWTETSKLTPGDAGADYFLGYSVALSGPQIIGGAIHESHAGSHCGAAYVFENTSGNWTQTAKLIATDGGTSHLFGYSVALHGDVAVVGAIGVPQVSYQNVGAAYVFERQGTQWPQTQKLISPNPSSTQFFACAVAVNADAILVGAFNNHLGAVAGGAVFAYRHPAADWVQSQVLLPADLTTSDNFGITLSISGDHAVIGSHSPDVAPAVGAAYVFQEAGSSWVQAGKCIPSDFVYGDTLGNAVAIDGNTVLAGDSTDDDACPGVLTCDSGSAYFFEFAPGALQYGSCPAGSPCSNADRHGGCRNSTGQGAVLGAFGTNSVVADDLVLEARWLPAGVSAIGFMGRGRTSTILGDGLRVSAPALGSGLYRFPVQSASTRGVLDLGPGIVAATSAFSPAGQLQPGQVWNFQLWYRDNAGPCGSGTNTSNGLSVVFAP
jgi:hypothetical protein